MKRPSSQRIVTLAVAIAVVARLLMLLVSPMRGEISYEQLRIARNVVTGHGFGMAWPYEPQDPERAHRWRQDSSPHPSAFMPPAVPAFYVALFGLIGPGATAVHIGLIVQCLIGGLIPLLVYRIARRLVADQSAAYTAVLSLLYLPGLLSSATPAGAVWYSVGALAVIDIAQTVYRHGRGAWLLGLLLGLVALMRGEFLYIGVVLALVPALRKQPLQAAAALLCMMAVVGPWMVRNTIALEAPVAIISHPWREVWRGANARATGSSYDAEGWNLWEGERFPHITARLDSVPLTASFEVNADKVFRDEVLKFVVDDPLRWVGLLAKKSVMLWTVDPYYPRGTSLAFVIPSLATSAMILIGAWMLLMSVRKRKLPLYTALPIVVVGVLLTAVFSLTYVQPRYQIYVFTALFPLAAVPLEGLRIRFARQQPPR